MVGPRKAQQGDARVFSALEGIAGSRSQRTTHLPSRQEETDGQSRWREEMDEEEDSGMWNQTWWVTKGNRKNDPYTFHTAAWVRSEHGSQQFLCY